MNTKTLSGMIGLFIILPLLFVQSPLCNGIVYQHDWSGGPGVSGPVTFFWLNTFSTYSGISWSEIPGKLFLDISSTTHPINADMGGCRYAFPADMDGDGDIDVVASETHTSTPYKLAWFENDGSGGGWDIHIISAYYALIWCAYPSDLDNDGDMDVVGSNLAISKQGLEWWRNDDGVGDSWTRFRVVYWGSPPFVCTSDINGDDTLDLVAPSGINSGVYSWWETMTFPPDSSWGQRPFAYDINNGTEVFSIDLDNDGDMDVIGASNWSHGLKWYENLDGTGLLWSEHEIGNYQSEARSVHAADIDNDEDYDVVHCGHGEVCWFENLNGSGTSWEEHVLDSGLEGPRGVHAADVTNDGYVDILLANYSGLDLFLYRNMDGTGGEWGRFRLAGSPYTDVEVADFNEDGLTDILAAASDGIEVSWHELRGYTSGWLESSILDVNSYPQWDSISWTGDEPLETDIFFQIRTSNDWEDMGNWCDTIFDPTSLFGIIDSTHRYIQYRVGMTAENEFDTPTLEEVRFYWTYLGIEGGEENIEFSVTAAPNPSMGAVSILVPPLFSEDVQLLVYDISGKVVADLSEGEGNVFQWDCRDSSGSTVPSGIYIIQGIVGERSTSARFVKL